MRVLLVGGVGFVGAHLARRLIAAGHQAACFDTVELAAPSPSQRLATTYRRRLRLLAGAQLHQGDASIRAEIREAIERLDPDCICYLAATPLVGQVDASPSDAGRAMLLGLANTLDAVRERVRPCRFVFVSSSMVYGHFGLEPMPEDGATAPVNLYGGFKLAGETLTRTYFLRTPHEAVVVRPSGVYGATDIHGRVVQKCCEAALTGEPFIASNPDRVFIDFTAVEDLAQGLALAATHPAAAGETFNLTFGQGRSLAELVDVVTRASGALRVVRSGDEAGDRPRRGALDIGKARRLLGYAPTVRLEEGVASYLAELRGELGLDAGQKVLRTSA